MTQQEQSGVNPAGVNPENNNAGGQPLQPREGDNPNEPKPDQVDLGKIVQTLNQINENQNKLHRKVDGWGKEIIDVRHKVNEMGNQVTTPQTDNQDFYPDSPEAILLKREREDSEFFFKQAIEDFQRENSDYAEGDNMADLIENYYRRKNANQRGDYRSKDAVIADFNRAAELRKKDKMPMTNQPNNPISYGVGDTTPSATSGQNIINQPKKNNLNLNPIEEQIIIEKWGSVDNYLKAKEEFEGKKINETEGYQRLQN